MEKIVEFKDSDLKLIQNEKGFPVSQESVFLVEFIERPKWGRYLDIGSGTGVISMMLARKFDNIRITGIEIQKSSVEIAHRNTEMNRMGKRVKIINGDIRLYKDIFQEKSFDAIVCNPPFQSKDAGRSSPSVQSATARQNITMTMEDLVQAAGYLLKHKGFFYLVHSIGQMVSLTRLLSRNNLEPKRMRFVHHSRETRASAVLIESRKGARGGLDVDAPRLVDV